MRQLQIFSIRRGTSDPQTVVMPRRARITGIHVPPQGNIIQIFAEVEHDADTKAFDTQRHMRTFARRNESDTIPADAALVGFHNGTHLYEMKTP